MAGTSNDAATAIARGLRKWAAVARTGAAVSLAGTVVTMDACDPGTSYKVGPDRSDDAFFALVSRNSLAEDVLHDGAGQSLAVCYADTVIAHFSVAAIKNLNSGSISAADKAKLRALARTCA